MYSVGFSQAGCFGVLKYHEQFKLKKSRGVFKMGQRCHSGRKVGKAIRDKIMDTPFQADFEEELKDPWCKLWIQSGRSNNI